MLARVATAAVAMIMVAIGAQLADPAPTGLPPIRHADDVRREPPAPRTATVGVPRPMTSATRTVVPLPAHTLQRVDGIVQSPSGPAGQATIHAILHTTGERPAFRLRLAPIEARGCGGFSLDLSTLGLERSPLFRSGLLLTLTAASAGHLGETSTIPAPFAAPAPEPVVLWVARDPHSVRALVVDRHGEPVPNAAVFATANGRAVLLGRSTGVDGSLTFLAPQDGVTIHAVCAEHGRSRAHALPSVEARLVLDRPLGIVRGAVRHPSGTPVAGVEVDVVATRVPARGVDGELRARVTTDAAGRFVAAGLAGDDGDGGALEYRVHLVGAPGTAAQGVAGGPAVELVTPLALVTVSVTDAAGLPLDRASVAALAWDGDWAGRVADDLARGATPPADALAAAQILPLSAPGPVFVTPGSFIVVEAVLPGAGPRTRASWIPPLPASAAIEFVLEVVPPDAGLELGLRVPADVPVETVDVTVRTPLGDLVVDASSWIAPFDDRLLALAPGRYAIAMRARGALAERHLLPSHTLVDVPPRGVATAKRALDRGAALEVRVEGPGADVAEFVVGLRESRGRRILTTARRATPDGAVLLVVERPAVPAPEVELTISRRGGRTHPLRTPLGAGRQRFCAILDRHGEVCGFAPAPGASPRDELAPVVSETPR